MLANSVEKRFISIILAVLILLVAPLFILFFHLSNERYRQDAIERGQIMLEANAKALGKPLWDLDTESVRQITRAIAAARSVTSVHVRDTAGEIDIRIPEDAAKDVSEDVSDKGMTQLSAEISYTSVDGVQRVGTIEMDISPRLSFAEDRRSDTALIAIFVIAVLAIFAAAIIGNRQLVMRPLLKLTAAIEATRRLGSRHHVDWYSEDEMGMLASNFNEMQEHLSREEDRLKQAHARVSRIYNHTPAMLYSVDAKDRITAASDYFLLYTGYAREHLIGRQFTDLVEPEFQTLYSERARSFQNRPGDNSVTLKFRCADDRLIDVLIRETFMEPMLSQTASALSVMTDVTELKAAEHRNHIQAITDHLTGLLNRQGFETAIESAISSADRDKSELACLFVDLDRFKCINDNLGHAAGDDLLRHVVSLIRHEVGPSDIVSRLGGDEFAILLAGAPAMEKALETADRISHAIERKVELAGNQVQISASIGVALYPQHAPNASELLQKSDLAMYARKKAGKNGTRVFDPALANEARDRAFMEKNIEAGLQEDWFDAYLQPIHDLKTGRIAGFEALMRLVHPVEGIIAPGGIIKIAEETGSITRIGERIFEKAVSRLKSFSHIPEIAQAYVAVNISPLQFEPALLERMATVLLKHAIHPSRIVVEITEAVLMNNDPIIQQVLEALSASGFRIALDDFGTGYSSLSYLNRFPVDIVKIDQSFIRAMTDDDETASRKSRMLVEGIKTISHQMGCTVVAEGVETAEQRDKLEAIGIDNGQGYLFSRPVPANEIIARFANRTGNTGQTAAA
ncbi:putative bifunctional diguanylate cyclase/phosphodiesterase [Rhizobium sp.]